MSNRDPLKAQIGTRLIPTGEAHIRGVVKPDAKGTLVGFGRKSRFLIRVLVDGYRHPQRFHAAFWRCAQTHAEKASR